MEIIDGYKITESSASKVNNQRPSIRVRNQHGQVAAVVYGEKGKLLKRIRTYLLCPERHDLVWQLRISGVPDETIEKIISLPPEESECA